MAGPGPRAAAPFVRPRSPEAFRVDEIPLYAPAGRGAHTFVRVEKRLRTTEQVAAELADAAGVRPHDVGYAGLKDRVAVTRQWFSVPGLDPERARDLRLRDARVLEAVRHPHKLRTGQLRGNRFEIELAGAGEHAARRAARALGRLRERGMPNRFGPQRFGRDGRNAERGRALLAGERRARGRVARLLLSALQAEAFNAVLAARGGACHRVEPGDVALVHRSGGLFVVEDAEREEARAESFEISPTGPLFGPGRPAPTGRIAALERAVLAAHGVPCDLPGRVGGVRLRGGRRPLRVRPENALLEPSGDALRLHFELPPGSYATVLLEELFPDAAVDVNCPGEESEEAGA